MKSEIKVLALVPYALNTTPSQRYRIEQWEPLLKQEGIALNMVPFADERLMALLRKPGHLAAKSAAMISAFARRSALVAATASYDAVFIHRAACLAGPAALERVIKLYRRPVIFDFDDAIYFLHTAAANRLFGWLKFPGKTASICRQSAHIIVGNSYLADYARQHNPRVTVIPSSVDTEHYCAAGNKASNPRVVIGWMGSSTSQTHLEMFAPALRELTARQDIEFRVVSDREPDLPGVKLAWRRWSADSEIDELARFDIGIMPMPDDRWSRGKCAMKALLYMSMGMPVVCSAVGTNRELIRHGENGFLAATADEWLSSLNALIVDRSLRDRLGAAGRRTVEQNYSMNHCAKDCARVIRETVENRSSAMICESSKESLARSVE